MLLEYGATTTTTTGYLFSDGQQALVLLILLHLGELLLLSCVRTAPLQHARLALARGALDGYPRALA